MSDRAGEILARGLASASDADLLALALSRRPDDLEAAAPGAAALLRRYGRANLVKIQRADLAEQGLDGHEATRVMALLELGRRASLAGAGEAPLDVNDPVSALRLFPELPAEDQEHFEAAFLDVKNQLIQRRRIHSGTTTMSLVGIREVFREGLRAGAVSMIVAHNHPSGDPEPSPEDLDVTRRLVDAGRLLDVALLDHLIVGRGRGRFVSLRQRGLISD